ncbi:bifunctional tetrahydrofolate synthase/dihydrofolate synthase [Natronospira bacteriovora]|uniref:Dihydrofolate synthase/folylpolyglutamate synthase n=1 Tax=Natronospira bacteriovora TaxID=3069753 RepID=A0ABU0W4I2_9GAMM|nr:bifunctional tetrahydrofolate synthase/dihydrofolate synthase [Natronospira sp. AB-CW4]MDQ2068928.1 bifunctional tetrahydrofolate synthase/dihydrofolate synthase [Natronospira sp. AB-CW4]
MATTPSNRRGAPGPGAPLSDWLSWLEGLHSAAIDLGLDRLIPVRDALGLKRPGFRVLTVAGTNGKGSSVALAEALLRADGCRTGAYTSPHLIEFNERIRVDGENASDQAIVSALCQVEAARGDASLSYFEYTTLAALLLFREQGVDHAVLEVGLGGRLDAVNMVDADVALLTRVALDHADWLGSDLAGIAREKAGVCRPGRSAVVADGQVGGHLHRAAEDSGARVHLAGRDFSWQGASEENWSWRGPQAQSLQSLPVEPWWQRSWQRDNASGALAAVALLRPSAVADGPRVVNVLSEIRLPGRVQRMPGPPETLLDVAHNPDAALALADWLAAHPVAGSVRAVIGMKADKDVGGVIAALMPYVDEWWPADLSAQGGLGSAELSARLPDTATVAMDARTAALTPEHCWRAASRASADTDRILVLGSFFTVGPVLREWRDTRQTAAVSQSVEKGSP